jgi:hypothetical protein
MLEYLKLFLTVFLGSGAAIAIIKLIFDNRKERRERSEATKYLAIQLAFQFEGFAIECAQGVSDHQTAVENDGHAGALLWKVPSPAQLPTSEAYRFMESAILSHVLAFSQQCRMAQLAADFWVDTVGDRDCYQAAVEENTVSMGSEALDIARAIRNASQLGGRALTFAKWNIDDFLAVEMRKVKERIERQERMKREHDASGSS